MQGPDFSHIANEAREVEQSIPENPCYCCNVCASSSMENLHLSCSFPASDDYEYICAGRELTTWPGCDSTTAILHGRPTVTWDSDHLALNGRLVFTTSGADTSGRSTSQKQYWS